jgi:hypothetical protein
VAGTNEGSYAEAAALPTDAKKRKRQEEAFKQVQPATGDGPFSYYNTDSELFLPIGHTWFDVDV